MKNNRDLTSLMRTARESFPSSRLLSRDDVDTMLTDRDRTAPVVLGPAHSYWRTAMIAASFLTLVGALLFVVVGDGDDQPIRSRYAASVPDVNSHDSSSSGGPSNGQTA